MKLQNILETLGLLAGAGVALAGCAKPASPATEIPAARAASQEAGEACLHADGCCGGHTPGDGACGEGELTKAKGETEADPSAATSWTRKWTVAPGKFAEINLELAAGDTMSATFSTDGGSLKWNVHSHEGREVTIHASGDDAAGTAHHVADEAGMYSFLWKNEGGTPVLLTVELESGASRIHSTHPAE